MKMFIGQCDPEPNIIRILVSAVKILFRDVMLMECDGLREL